MIIGDKIKLVKPMGAFINVGEICPVTDIKDGLIEFTFSSGKHLGYMSYNEFEKYFVYATEEAEEKKTRRSWTDWTPTEIEIRVPDGGSIRTRVLYRNNGKIVQGKMLGYKAKASCHKDDIFKIEMGLEIVKQRLIGKYLKDYCYRLARYIGEDK